MSAQRIPLHAESDHRGLAMNDTTDEASGTSGTDQPGVLRGTAWLTLQTRQAQRLVKGRSASADRPAIIGLLGFAHLLRPVWEGARTDDPYADWWLLKVHDALEQAHQALADEQATQARHLAALDAIEVHPAQSTQPIRMPLQFSNPYAFRAARLVADYDTLVRNALTARHVGLVTRDEQERVLQLSGRRVRRAMVSPLGYRFLGLTRRDLEQATANAQRAREAMGELPAEVLNGTRRAPHAPVRPSAPTVVVASERIELLPDAVGKDV